MYPIIHVPDDASELPEQLGTKFKFWFRDPTGKLTLFKEGRPGTGENWSEKVCAEIGQLLGIPHATYDFARWRQHSGVATPSFVPSEGRLILGNEILGRVVKGYSRTATYRARQHTTGLVAAVMRQLQLPLGYVPPC